MNLIKFSVLALVIISLGFGIPASGQDRIVSVAILSFQDETGANAPAELGQKLAQDLQQKIAIGYKDLLPRLITSADATSLKGLTIEQIASLGKQNGARFVVRGGLLTVTSEPAGDDSKVTVQVYADLILADTAALVTTVRAEGSGTQTGSAPQLSAIDPKSEQFAASGIGQAFAGAIAQLADSIHQAIAAQGVTAGQTTSDSGQPGTQTGTQPATQPDASQAEAAKTAEADTELQQLIAQAESLISSGANANTQSIGAVSQALEALKSALASKASLMEQGQDTSQADQEIATQRQALETAVAQVTAEASASPGAAATETGQQPSGQKKGFMDKIDEFAGQALSTLQKIQQMRATLSSFNESSTYGGPPNDQSNPGGNPSATNAGGNNATEQQLGDANGVVTDQNGNPIPNAQVTDQNSGATTTTNSSGQYNLQGLLPNQLAKLVVKAGGQTMSSQAQIIGGRSTTLDFQVKPNAGTATQASVLPSTVILNSQTGAAGRGILKGVVQDAQGSPVPRALVTLKGLGIARTNSQGEYQFLNAPAGEQQLIVNQSGLKTRTAQVQVLAAKTNEARIRFAPSDRIGAPGKSSLSISGSGTVLKGTVSDNQDRPVTGAKVSVIQGQSALAVFTGPNGAFELRNLKSGPYRIIASKAGYQSSTQNITLSSGRSEPVIFQLKQQSSPLVGRLLTNESAQRGVIRGRVFAANGSAVANAAVTLKAMGGSAAIATNKTNQNGEYLFNVREGRYEVRVSHPSYQAASHVLDVKAGGLAQGDFSLKPVTQGSSTQGNQTGKQGGQGSQNTQGQSGRGAFLVGETQVVKPGRLLGQVLDAKTGRPIAGATVSVKGQKSVTTDLNGNFVLTNLPAGNYQANISKTGYSPLQRPFSVASGGTARLNVSLTLQSSPPIRIVH